MYELSVETTFAAAHAIDVAGEREPVHGHNWHATVTVAGPALDADGLLIDFHVLEKLLHDVVRPWHNRDLNQVAPFDAVNPTAENVAAAIARAMSQRLDALTGPDTPVGAPDPAEPPMPRIVSVRLTEAPGCTVIYYPDRTDLLLGPRAPRPA